ncbi:hypothetical protein COI59_29445 [Bacillus toyonensis]|nr:hypothetical protein COI59_29445 [Bacillus toyonensis]
MLLNIPPICSLADSMAKIKGVTSKKLREKSFYLYIMFIRKNIT